MLNNPDVRTTADLHVLGGDLAGTGVFGRLKTLVTDFYYRDDHDVVVNTPAMLGGIERSAPVRYWIDTGNEVTHFNTSRGRTRRGRLCDLLITGHADVHVLDVEPSQVDESAYQKRDAATRPTLVLVPGFMGSHLETGGRVWGQSRPSRPGGTGRARPRRGGGAGRPRRALRRLGQATVSDPRRGAAPVRLAAAVVGQRCAARGETEGLL